MVITTTTWANSSSISSSTYNKNDDKYDDENDSIIKRESALSTSQKLIESKKVYSASDMTTATTATSKSQLELQFSAACDAIQNLPKNGSFQPSNELLLKFYGYFKQATQGPCVSLSRPSIFKVVERAKYDAWHSVKHLSKEEAMQGYISEINNIIETMPHNQHVQKLFQALNQTGGGGNDDDESQVNTTNERVTAAASGDSLLTLNGKSTKSTKKTQNGGHHHVINEATTTTKKSSRKAREPIKLNGNGTLNGNHHNHHVKVPAAGFNTQNSISTDYFDPTSASEDDEDYCDTSDNINGIDDQIYTDNVSTNHQLATNTISSHQNAAINSFQMTTESPPPSCSSIQLVESIKKQQQNGFHPILQKLGGETPNNSTSFSQNNNASTSAGGGGGGGYQNYYQDRQQPSRPESTHSMNFGGKGFGGGGGGGGGFNGNGDNYMNDSNRQILLILYRVQQDINNILTRLSYLESSVLSLQNHMQITRMENSLQMNNQSSAFSLVNNNNKDSRLLQQHPHQLSPQSTTTTPNENKLWSYVVNLIKSVDWKTFLMAVAWPLVIRLIFFVMKKVRFLIKLKRIKSQSKLGYVL